MLTHPTSTYRHSPAVTIRWAGPDDAERLEVLSQLDEDPVPAPPLLLAFVGDELWAARSLSTEIHIADPFRPSAEVAKLLADRGRQLTVRERQPRLRRLRLRRREAPLACDPA